MKDRLPVVAAIPNYNMGEQLVALLPELAQQDYADVFVLDDDSTDGSREIVEGFNHGSGVHFVAGAENKGAGPTRNLVIGALGYKAIIHFLDADITLRTERIPEVVHDIMPSEPIGFVGGLALTPQGTQSVWNYGPRQGLRGDVGAPIQMKIETLVTSDPEKGEALRKRFERLLVDWPDPFSEPVRRQVFWNIEQNLLISSDVFAEVGGFNDTLREHEIQDLAIRLYNRGLSRWFDPSISVQHKNEQNVRDYNRQAAMFKAELRIARMQGIRTWFLPNGKFKAEL
jgi:GT2 family glycosyltransferase